MDAGHLSHLTLDALRLGALGEAEAAAARAHLDTCARCAGARLALEREAEEFTRRFEPAALAAATLDRVEARRGAPVEREGARGGASRGLLARAAAWLVPAAPVAWVAVGLLLPHSGLAPTPGPGAVAGVEDTRPKGPAPDALELFLLGDGQPEALPGGRAPAGSSVLLRFQPGARAYLRFVWLDGAGELRALFPDERAPAVPIAEAMAPLRVRSQAQEDRKAEVPEGVPKWFRNRLVLDADPRPETLVAAFCDRDVSYAEIAAVARGGAGATAPEGCDVARKVIEKQP